jgi:hypothetical protein
MSGWLCQAIPPKKRKNERRKTFDGRKRHPRCIQRSKRVRCRFDKDVLGSATSMPAVVCHDLGAQFWMNGPLIRTRSPTLASSASVSDLQQRAGSKTMHDNYLESLAEQQHITNE